MVELGLLRGLLLKENYSKYRTYLKREDFTKELYPILQSIDQWFKTNTEEPKLEDIANVTFAHGIQEKSKDYLKKVFTNMSGLGGQQSIKFLYESFRQNRILEDLATAAYDASTGHGSVINVLNLADKLKEPALDTDYEFVTDDIHEILNKTIRTPGLRWRLNSLNRSLGSLRKGNFGFVFARPETGKTTFLASEVTHMSTQLSSTSGPILWINNEEVGEVVKQRCYEAALGATADQLNRAESRALTKYAELTKGKIWILDDSSIGHHKIDEMAERLKPSLIVMDQIDKIKGFTNDRDDLRMGAIYQWARELAKKYCPVIGISQASEAAGGKKWLHMEDVANAKTAKQAEADFILGIGRTYEAGQEFIRYFNISKNKLMGDQDSDPSMRHARFEVLIQPEIARYEDYKKY